MSISAALTFSFETDAALSVPLKKFVGFAASFVTAFKQTIVHLASQHRFPNSSPLSTSPATAPSFTRRGAPW